MPLRRLGPLLSTLLLPLIALGNAWAQEEEAQEDYLKLRMGFAESETFNPIALQELEREVVKRSMEAWKEQKAFDGTEMLYDLLQYYPLSMEAHIRLADGYKLLLETEKDKDKIAYYENLEGKHRYVYEGLVQSVFLNADGKTPETAFEVITFSEEVWVLRHLRMLAVDRNLEKEKKLVIYQAVERDGTQHTVYFNVARVIDAIEKLKEQQKTQESEKAPGATG